MSGPPSQPGMDADHTSPMARGALDPPDWDGLEKILEELPPGIPILPPGDATNFSKYRHKPPLMPAADAWKVCTDAMEKYDSDLCKAYREEIDTLLVFAGLFSAVVTGFTVESYQWLQDDPSDATNALLAQIARSVSANGTATVSPSSSGMGRSVSARINAYWFISLALSLSAALVAILAKQWVREFERRASDMTPREVVGVRQLKFEGLEYWKVGDIVSILPLLLQLSLALFALGVLDLLWHLHVVVAFMVFIPTGAALLFYLSTTFLPVLQYSQRARNWSLPPQCAYKSPQALLVLRIYQTVARTWSALDFGICLSASTYYHNWSVRNRAQNFDRVVWSDGWTKSWSQWDNGFYVTDRYSSPRRSVGGSHFRGLYWLSQNLDKPAVKSAFWNCLWDEVHSADIHPADGHFPNGEERDTRSRCGLLHGRTEHEKDALYWAPIWQPAIFSAPDTQMGRESMSEMLIQSLPTMDVSVAVLMFRQFEGRFSDVRSLVKAVAFYGRQHASETGIAQMIALTSDIVARCRDYDSQLALHWAVVSFEVNLMRTKISSWSCGWNSSSVQRNALHILSRSQEDFIQHPRRLHRLPHILQLAALLQAQYEWDIGPLTWPIPSDVARVFVLRYKFDVRRVSHPEWVSMVTEILKISIRGVDCATPSAGHIDEMHDVTQSVSDLPGAEAASSTGRHDVSASTPHHREIERSPNANAGDAPPAPRGWFLIGLPDDSRAFQAASTNRSSPFRPMIADRNAPLRGSNATSP